ncbi:MAG: NAD-dependent epimerase/dehydratase family protein [Bradymonadia bacterium]
MKVMVTGGAGFIGSHIVDALVARGDTVTVLDDLSTGKRDNLAHHGDLDSAPGQGGPVQLFVGSVTDMQAVQAAAEGCALIYHEAAVASVQRTVEAPLETNAVNLGGTLNVLRAAQAVGATRVVFAGSAAVYGDSDELPLSEGVFPRPMSPYAVEKLASEQYVKVWSQLFGVETVTLRYFNVFGPRQDPSSPYSGVISIFVDRLLRGADVTIFGDGEQTRDFIYIGDVVQANMLAGTVPEASGGVFNVARGATTSLNQLYAMLAEIVGGAPPVKYGPARQGDIKHSLARIDAARNTLGFDPTVPVQEGLARLVESVKG